MSNWGGVRERKPWRCRKHAWCGKPRSAAYKAGMPKGRAILVVYEQSGTERVFCSGPCVENYRPPNGTKGLLP